MTFPSLRFDELTSEEVGKAAEAGTLILFPIGQVEEHGLHLPLNTDAVIAEETAMRVAAAMPESIPTLVMPVWWSGYSNTIMQKWPGTICVRSRVVMDAIFDICSSLLRMGFRNICLMNAHGHHTDLLRVVVRELADAHGADVVIADPAPLSAKAYRTFRKSHKGGSIHGGEWETSLVLHYGKRVLMEKAHNRDAMRYQTKFNPGDNFEGSKPVFWSTWNIQPSETGIYGDPTAAEAETGRRIVEAVVAETVEFLTEYVEYTRPRPFRTRPIGPSDAGLVLKYFEGLSQATRDFFHPHLFDEAAAQAVSNRNDAANYTIMAVTPEDEMIGYAFIGGGNKENNELPILGIGIVDAWQGKGVGRALMEDLHREAKRRGWPGLRMTVFKTNVKAKALYERFGYVVTGDKTTGPSAGKEVWMECRF